MEFCRSHGFYLHIVFLCFWDIHYGIFHKYRKLFGIATTIFIILRRVIIMVSGSIVCGWQEDFGYVHYLI